MFPRPNLTAPGELDDGQIRALWLLRTSIYRLKPHIDPEQDFAKFREFVAAAYVGRMLDDRGKPLAMFCHQRVDGELMGRPYRLGLFEYGYALPQLRGDPLTSLMYSRLVMSCRRLVPGVASYFVGVGYPRSLQHVLTVVPKLRLDGDANMSEFERALLDIAIERLIEDSYEPHRRVVEMPTLPDELSASWLARHGNDPIYRAFVERAPDWQTGKGLIAIGNLDGAGQALAVEVGRRLARRFQRM